ncbi:hypothetical protein PBI_SPORTO_80 [Arthrobacter phage Sporto]|nr:hypothetical protein PBI_SPORTO_80 [Arthrobacter phage Sporto]
MLLATFGQLAKSEKSLWAFVTKQKLELAKNVTTISDLATDLASVGHYLWAVFLCSE